MEWREVASPTIQSENSALVRPFAVAKCDLDDVYLMDNLALKIKLGKFFNKIDPEFASVFGTLFNGPFPFGHECVAEIVDVGEKVVGLKKGDVVSVPFQISCGTCSHCNRGWTAACTSEPNMATFGFGKHLHYGGAMSDLLEIKYADAMLLKIPEYLDPVALASLSDNIPDAYRHLHLLEKKEVQSILIISDKASSVALYTLLMAKAMGAPIVDFIDKRTANKNMAQKLGADHIFDHFDQIKRGYDLVVDAGSTTSALQMAIKKVRPNGFISSSGIYIKKTKLSLLKMYQKGVHLSLGLTNAHTESKRILELLKHTPVDFKKVTSLQASWDNAIDAFLTPEIKVVVERPRLYTP